MSTAVLSYLHSYLGVFCYSERDDDNDVLNLLKHSLTDVHLQSAGLGVKAAITEMLRCVYMLRQKSIPLRF